MTDPREAEAAWEEQNIVELSDKWDEPDAIAHMHAGFIAGFRAGRSAAPVETADLLLIKRTILATSSADAFAAFERVLAALSAPVAPSEPKPEAVAIPCPNCAPARHEAAQCLLCAGSGAIGKVKSGPEAVRPTDGELIATARKGLLSDAHKGHKSNAWDALSELKRRINNG